MDGGYGEREMASLKANDVYNLVELLKDRKVVGSKWVYKRKVKADGSVERFKSRLVAQGFSQKAGQDYDETFSPVVRFESIHSIIAMAVQNEMMLHQMDVTSAPRCWNMTLDHLLKNMGFEQTKSDPCLYISSEGELCIIAIYVDDILLATKSKKRMKDVKSKLSAQFEVKDLGDLQYLLGVSESFRKVIMDWSTCLYSQHLREIWFERCQASSNTSLCWLKAS